MSDAIGLTGSLEGRDDAGDKPGDVYGFWIQQLKLAEKEDKKFVNQGRKIVRRYRDELRRRTDTSPSPGFNILWSNVETLKPILYARLPKPDVQQRHRNGEVPARLGAEILERALGYEDDLDEFDAVMNQVVEDRLLPGRGVARVFYEPEFGEEEDDPDAEPDEDGDYEEAKRPADGDYNKAKRPTFRPVTNERAAVRYVFWEDYRHSPARGEQDIWWKAYRSYMTRDELVKRFGKKYGEAITLDYTPKGLDGESESGPQADAFKKAQIWEIWDKDKKQVVWIAPSYPDGPCDTKDDPLELPGFFPSPKPLSATTTNETTVPVADYSEYQDQAIELDILTARIDKLTSALAVKGFYAGASKAEIQQLVESGENMMVAVEDWAAFADKGGVPGLIAWFPMEQVAKVLLQLYDSRERVKKTLYEITGMADILRGETNPTETLGAQQLKSQFATRRLTKAQKDVARFARDLMRLRGFVMARQFSPETFTKMSGLPNPMPALPPPPPMTVPAPPPQAQPGPPMGPPGGNVVPHPAMQAA